MVLEAGLDKPVDLLPRVQLKLAAFALRLRLCHMRVEGINGSNQQASANTATPRKRCTMVFPCSHAVQLYSSTEYLSTRTVYTAVQAVYLETS